MRILANLFRGILSGLLAGLLIYVLLRPRKGEGFRLVLAPARAKKAAGMDPLPEKDDLEAIRGIGPAYARRLNDAGILTYADLASQTPSGLLEILGPRARSAGLDSWIVEAQRLG